MADLVALLSRLIALRDDVLRQLAEADHLDGGLLAVLGRVARSASRPDARFNPASVTICRPVSAVPVAIADVACTARPARSA
jgi:hypothetical protein